MNRRRLGRNGARRAVIRSPPRHLAARLSALPVGRRFGQSRAASAGAFRLEAIHHRPAALATQPHRPLVQGNPGAYVLAPPRPCFLNIWVIADLCVGFFMTASRSSGRSQADTVMRRVAEVVGPRRALSADSVGARCASASRPMMRMISPNCRPITNVRCSCSMLSRPKAPTSAALLGRLRRLVLPVARTAQLSAAGTTGDTAPVRCAGCRLSAPNPIALIA